MVSQQAVEQFKQMYFEDYQVVLSDDEATEKANKLFTFLNTVYRQDKTLIDKREENMPL